jgi:ubiquinone biosynthesis protein
LVLEDVGGTWLKFGQVLSLQPDILPRAYCIALFDLLDRVPPFDLAEVEKTFRREHGRPTAKIFDEFETVPMASASIGQVHRARLGDRRLAVKIQRPDIARNFEPDLKLMRTMVAIITTLRIRRLYWLRRAITEFIEWTREELDYRYEARFMEALGHNSRDSESARVPQLVRELSTRRILVAELLDGPVLVDYLRAIEAGEREAFEADLEPRGFDRERLAENIIRNFVSDAFHHGLFHADLHPANLLILDDGVVGYVDFGITGSLSAYSRRKLVALTLALSTADPSEITRHYLCVATVTDDSDVPAYRRQLADLLEEWFETDRERPVLRVSYTRMMLDMLHLARRTDVVPTPDMMRYLRSVITADGLIARFAPTFDVSSYLQDVCEEYLRRQEWRDWLSPATMAEWAAGSSRLLVAAPTTIVGLLRRDRASTGSDDEPPEDDNRRALLWGLTALVAAVVAAVGGGEADLGINLFTAGLTTTVAAATMFLRALQRSE